MYRSMKATMAALVLTLAACGGSGGGTAPPPVANPPGAPAEGIAMIGLTDAPGDFLTYRVTVTGIALQAANGVVVETLPEAASVDFAEYVEATEFVTAASVPTGVYTGMTLALDYTDARIRVENAGGDAVDAVVVNADGSPVTQIELTVQFSDHDRFVIAPGIPAHVTLDFDLAASHEVDLAAQPAEATLDGVLIADTLLEHPKPRRARGLLREVDEAGSRFALNVRPFYHPRGDFGTLAVHTTDGTEFEIDGTPYLGAQGLTALAAKAPGTAVVAWGVLEPGTRRFLAERVLAGTSVPWGSADIAKGTVIARSGDVLTLRGTTLIRADMSVVFHDTLSVVIGPETTLRQQGESLLALAPGDVSVGQRVTAIGTVNDQDALDASLLRVLYSTLGGIATGVAPMTLDLVTVNGRRAGLYDFAGTGIDAAHDADPDAYDVDTGTLPLDGIDVGTPLKVRGLVAPFGTAPADFVARSLGDVSPLPARLHLRWLRPGVTDAVLSLDDSTLVLALDAEALSAVHHIVQAGVPQDLLAAGDRLTLQAGESGRGVFALRQAGQLQVFFDFARFSSALAQRLDGSTALVRIGGRGEVADANVLSMRRLLVTLH